MWHKLLTNASFQDQSQIAPIFACSYWHHMIWEHVYFMCILTSLTLLMQEIRPTSWNWESITIYRVSYIPGGDRAVFLNHQQYAHGFHHVDVCTDPTVSTWVESARRFARGYLVRLRTTPSDKFLMSRWAAQIRMETSNTQVALNATHFAGDQTMQINSDFDGFPL